MRSSSTIVLALWLGCSPSDDGGPDREDSGPDAAADAAADDPPVPDGGQVDAAVPVPDAGPVPCLEDEEDCGGECVRTAIDEDHCGACGQVCGDSEAPVCVQGECTCGPAGPCSGTATDRCCAQFALHACVDTTTDPGHCGDCGIACDLGTSCIDGVCLAPACDGTDDTACPPFCFCDPGTLRCAC